MARAGWFIPVLATLAVAGPAASPQEKPDAETLRSRERMALLDVRTILMAARQFAAWNGGYFGEPKCLVTPEACLPDFPKDQSALLDPTHDWLATRLGYVRKFHPGPPADDEARIRVRAAPGSVKSFAFTVSPERPGETGLRAFCGDSSGKVCAIAKGTEPPVKDGRCAPPCQELK